MCKIRGGYAKKGEYTEYKRGNVAMTGKECTHLHSKQGEYKVSTPAKVSTLSNGGGVIHILIHRYVHWSQFDNNVVCVRRTPLGYPSASAQQLEEVTQC